MAFKTRLFRTGYVLGISLVLASIIYFFAANWGGLERMEKISLSAGLVALFYACSFLPAKLRFWQPHQDFLARTLLAGGLIAFGVAVALIGQTYNSHADSYGLFLIWCLPALLLSVVVRHSWFYFITFILALLTLFFYFFPSGMNIPYTDTKLAFIYGLFAAFGLLIYILTQAGLIPSKSVQRLSFIVFHAAVWWLSNSFELGHIGLSMNFVTLAVLAASFYLFSKLRIDRWALSVTALFASAFAVLKFIELAEEFYSLFFFFYGLVFVGLLLTGNVFFFRYVSKLVPAENSTATTDADGTTAAAKRDSSGHMTAHIVATIVTIVGIIVGTISLTGLVFLASLAIDPEIVLFVLSLGLCIPMILIPKLNAVVRYTLLTIGYLAGIVAILWIGESVLSALYLILAAAGWIRLEGFGQRLFTYSIFNAVLGITLYQLFDFWITDWAYLLLMITAVNAAVYGLHHVVGNEAASRHLRGNGLAFTLIDLFWLTFIEDLFPYSHLLSNLVFFLLISALIFLFIGRGRNVDTTLCLILWFGYVGFQYYDLVWPLLNKSFTLLLIGLIVLVATTLLDRRFGKASTPVGLSERSLPYTKWIAILLIIILQFGFIGYQTATKERLLADGVSVKLELQPIDPRSLLQGDYVVLNYTISTPPESVVDQLDELGGSSKVKVVIKKDTQGAYQFDRFYKKGESLGEGEIMLNGKFDGWRGIQYGIESYFVPEGTGHEVERTARFAYVRVGSDGDAILERLSAK